MNKKIKNIASVIQTKSAAVLCTLCAVLFLASCAEDEMADGTHSQKQDLRTVSVNFDMPADKPSFGDGTASRAALDAHPAEILLGDSTLAVSRAEGGSQSRSEGTSSAWVNGDQILVKIEAGSTQGRLTLQYIDPAAIPAPASGEEPQTATAGWYLMKEISYVKYTGDDFTAYNAQGVTPMIAGDTSDDDELAIDFTEELILHLDWTASQPTVSIIYAPDMQWSLAQDNTVSMEQRNPATTATTAPELWTTNDNGWTTPQARLRVNTGRGNAGDVVTLTSSAFDSAWEVEPTGGIFTATTDAQGNAYFYGATTGNAALTSNFIVQLTQMRVPVPQPAAPISEGRSVALDNAKENVIITLDTPITLLEASDVLPVTLTATKAYKLMAEEKRTAAKTENINTLGVIDGTWGFESDPQGNLNDADAMAVQIKTAMAMGINQFTVVNGLTSLAQMYNTKSIVGQAVIRSTRATGVVSLVLNEDITSLQNVAFAYCMPLGSLSASAVTTIGAGAFNSCVYLTSLTFDKVITSVGTNAFDGDIVYTTTPWTTACDLTLAAGQQDAEDATLKVTAVGGKLMWAGKPWKSIKIGETEYTAVGDVLCSTNNGVPTTVIDDVTYAVIDGQCGITETDDGGNYIGTADHVTTLKAQIDAAMAMEIDHFLVINQLAKYETSTVETAVGAAIRELTSDENSSSNNGTIHITLQDATKVADYAFSGCRALKSVTVSAANAIGFSAFSGCFGLTTVTLPNVTTIDGSAFSSCTALTTVDLQKATTIGSEAFKSCTALTHTGIPWNMITSIGQYAFRSCTFTGTIELSLLTTVSTYAFDAANVSNCDLVLPAGQESNVTVSNDGKLMWAGAQWKSITLLDGPNGTAGTKYYIDNGVPTVEVDGTCGITGNNPTGDDNHVSAMTNKINVVANAASKVIVKNGLATYDGGLSYPYTVVGMVIRTCGAANGSITLVLDEPINEVPEDAFYQCNSLLKLSLPAAQKIGKNAFNNCTSLTLVELPAAQEIGNYAFNNCKSLTSVSLPAATSIGNSAFWFCTSLTSVSLPAATSIGEEAFRDCSALTSLTFGSVVQQVGSSVFFNSSTMGCDLFLAAGQLNHATYPVTASGGKLMWADEQWNSITVGGVQYKAVGNELYAVIDGTDSYLNLSTYIQKGNLKFYVVNGLSGITKAFTTSGTGASEGSISLVLDEGITKIPNNTFQNCNALGSVVANGVETIEYGAFSGTLAIRELTFKNVISCTSNFAFGQQPQDDYYWTFNCTLTLNESQSGVYEGDDIPSVTWGSCFWGCIIIGNYEYNMQS